jgi:hypothetical protein
MGNYAMVKLCHQPEVVSPAGQACGDIWLNSRELHHEGHEEHEVARERNAKLHLRALRVLRGNCLSSPPPRAPVSLSGGYVMQVHCIEYSALSTAYSIPTQTYASPGVLLRLRTSRARSNCVGRERSQRLHYAAAEVTVASVIENQRHGAWRIVT